MSDPRPQKPHAHEAGKLAPRPEDLAEAMDPWGLREVLRNPGRLLWINFLAGLIRGIGFTIGMALLGGLVLSRVVKPMLRAAGLLPAAASVTIGPPRAPSRK